MKRTSSTQIGVVALAGGVAATAVYLRRIRPWHLRWGATDDEMRRPLPDDDLLPTARMKATHAITIKAPVSQVWPWLVQMGQGRGGLYSYEAVENLMKLDIRNTNGIIPEFQNLKVGDTIPFSPDGFGPKVAALEPEKFLLLHGDSRLEATADTAPKMNGGYAAVSWLFFLEETENETTRLIERFRADWRPNLPGGLDIYLLWEPGAFIMERKMLLGIKQRAEALARQR